VADVAAAHAVLEDWRIEGQRLGAAVKACRIRRTGAHDRLRVDRLLLAISAESEIVGETESLDVLHRKDEKWPLARPV
jgi:hypothetical protein